MYITLPKGFESKKQLKRNKNFFMIYKGDKLLVKDIQMIDLNQILMIANPSLDIFLL